MTTVADKEDGPPPAGFLSSLVDAATLTHARAATWLALVALVAFLPGFFQIPPIDRDEARFAQATRQMVETGDYVDIRFQDEVRYKKPVGIYWLQAAAVSAAGAVMGPKAHETIAFYRIPSLIGAVGGVLLTYWVALAFVTRRAAFLAGLMMGTCVLLGVEARLAKTDAMLLFTTLAAIGVLARIYLAREATDAERRWTWPLIFWTAMAAGVLLKGPLIAVFVGLPTLVLVALERRARWLLQLRPGPGILWMLLLVLPWFLVIVAKTGTDFFQASVGDDLLKKVASGQESHGAPPGFYILLFFATFWPASILAGLAAPGVWRQRREPEIKFLLAWLVPAWIVFEIFITKLPHYVLPLYPAIAILIAGRFDPPDLSQKVWLTRGSFWWFAGALALAAAVVAVPLYLVGKPEFWAWPLAAAAVVAGFRAWWLYRADGAETSFLRAAAAAVLIAGAVYGIVVPALGPLFPSATLAQVVRAADCDNPQVASVGFHEPSLVFLAGTRTRLAEAGEAADFLKEGGCRLALVEAGQETAFARRADAIGLRVRRGARVEGINISGGRRVSIAVFRPAL
ncbi:MAG: ArnT family glycosyltransferase [Pseudorhodoplanes sp.]